MNLGSRLKQLLSERGITVTQLSRDAGIPAQTVYALINRDSNKADMDILTRLLCALQMDFFSFMGIEAPSGVTAESPAASAAPQTKTVEKIVEKVVVKEVPAAAPDGTTAVCLRTELYDRLTEMAAEEGITDAAVIADVIDEYMEAGFGYRQRPLRSILRDHKPSDGRQRGMDSYLL